MMFSRANREYLCISASRTRSLPAKSSPAEMIFSSDETSCARESSDRAGAAKELPWDR
jgi:hypothetical protein